MAKAKLDLLQGTLDMLILKTLDNGELHGYSIVRHIQDVTEGILRVEEGSLYPALHRMEERGWIKSRWGVSDNNRRARYYELTRSGRKRLETEVSLWEQFAGATSKVLGLNADGI